MMDKAPSDITICNLEVIVMPSGEILCGGTSLGWIEKFGKYLTPEEKEKNGSI